MNTHRSIGADPTSRFRHDIQGLRAIAVLIVVLYHAGVPFLAGGYVGVDVFFVISGFLITSHLLSGLRRDGKVRFASFYAKRARRILPVSFVVLVLSVVAALIWFPPLLIKEVWAGAVATALYLPNVLFALDGTNYLAETTPSLFQHYWSLGIEEQFYLVWPLLLALGFLWVKRPKTLFTIVLAIVILSFFACVFLTFRQQPWAFFLLPTRAWELGVGGLAAFLLTYRPRILRGAGSAIVGWAGIGGIIATATLFNSGTPFPGYWAALPVLATAAIIVSGDASPRGGPGWFLSRRPMMFIGLVSYSLYLVHWPLLLLPQAAVGFENRLPLWATLLLGAIGFPVAWLMYRFVEEPGRNARWLARARPRRSLLAAGAASVAVALLATGIYAVSSSRPLDAGRVAEATAITTPPVFTNYVPSNLTPSLRDVADDQPAIYENGCHLGFTDTAVGDCVYGDASARRIVLFGDSHAAQWFPAVVGFAEAHGYAVESHTKSSCPSVSADVLRDRVLYSQCTAWRDAVIDRINQTQPAIVLIANFGSVTFAESNGDYAETWGSALTETIDRINSPTAVIADTPNIGYTPSVCLSAHLTSATECGQPRNVALSSGTRDAEAEVTMRLGEPYIDMTDEICAEECSPIIGNTLVYRDAHHLTATFSAELSGTLGAKLGEVLDGVSG